MYNGNQPFQGELQFTKIGLLVELISIVIFVIGIDLSLTMETFPLAIFPGSILLITALLGFVSLAYT